MTCDRRSSALGAHKAPRALLYLSTHNKGDNHVRHPCHVRHVSHQCLAGRCDLFDHLTTGNRNRGRRFHFLELRHNGQPGVRIILTQTDRQERQWLSTTPQIDLSMTRTEQTTRTSASDSTIRNYLGEILCGT